MNVPPPVIEPRTIGLPRPVSSPVSDRPSENAMLIAGAERGREPGDERVARVVRRERDREDRRERRERAVDEPDHRRLHLLEQERMLVRRSSSRVYQSVCKRIEHKALLTSRVRGA